MSGLFQNEEENDCRDDEQFVFPKGATVSYKYFIGFINKELEVAKNWQMDHEKTYTFSLHS